VGIRKPQKPLESTRQNARALWKKKGGSNEKGSEKRRSGTVSTNHPVPSEPTEDENGSAATLVASQARGKGRKKPETAKKKAGIKAPRKSPVASNRGELGDGSQRVSPKKIDWGG